MYKVEIQETLSVTIEIDAENAAGAIDAVKNKYLHGEYILDSQDFVMAEFKIKED